MSAKNKIFVTLWLAGLLSLSSIITSGQTSILEQKVSLQFSGEEVETALYKIEKLYHVSFSYNSDIIPNNSHVNINAKSKPLGKVLTTILGKDYHFKSTGKYIIILRKTAKNDQEVLCSITGSVVDFRSGKPISQATIYDMGSMQSVLSDSNGNFSLTFEPKTSYLGLRCSKTTYCDSVIMYNPAEKTSIIFSLLLSETPVNKLNSRSLTLVPHTDSVAFQIIKSFVTDEMLINSRNVWIPDKRLAQLSLLPNIGTNLRMSGSVVNHFSINFLGGYSAGVSGFEAGGIVNINKYNVNGIQLSCLINLSEKSVNGFQASGLLNRTGENVNGVQASCVANIGADTVRGVQMAGIINVCKKSLRGLQFSFGANISRGKETGSQVAGLLNYAPRPHFQFGIINIADTSDGAPLGVINIVKHGYYSFTLAADELQNGYLLFNMGTPKLYSILGVSGRTIDSYESWSINYGLGSHFMSQRRLGINAEFLTSVINTTGRFDSTTMSRVSLSARLSLRMGKHIYLSAGPSYNVLIAGAASSINNEYIHAVLPKNREHLAPRNTRFEFWPGLYGSMSFKF